MSGGSLKVLVASKNDPSRAALLRLLEEKGQFQISRVLAEPSELVACVKKLRPNAIILSEKLEASPLIAAIGDVMSECPTPILIIAANHTPENSPVALDALRAGALSIVRLPAEGEAARRGRAEQELLETVRAMSQVKLVRRWRRSQSDVPAVTRETKRSKGGVQIIAMAASTGGPAALQLILSKLPEDFPVPILIVQHIAHGFIHGVVEWLNKTSPIEIRVAIDGERLQAGTAYFAPDDHHLGLKNRSCLRLSTDAPINGFRPSATYLFDSVTKTFDGNALAVILTGMGEDGFEGLKTFAAANGRIIAQSESSSVVFGMPGVAVRHGLANQILAPDSIARALVEACTGQVHT